MLARVVRKTNSKRRCTMATVAELLAKVEALQGLSDDQTAKSDASHAAAENVTTVTEAEQAKIDAATAAFTIAVSAAQGESDTAKLALDAATATLDAAIDEIVEMVKTLAK